MMIATPASSKAARNDELVWGGFFHLGYNSYSDRDDPAWLAIARNPHLTARPYLRFDTSLWHDLVPKMVEAGLNMVVLALADGVRYQSHPEIAVEGAWSVEELRAEVARLRGLGLEPIPKLNFSTAHDAWLGPYARCVSTETYYNVCRDLIAEVIDIFDTPRLFHIGMDEETLHHQRAYEYVVIRQHDLWWRDLAFLVEEVERAGVRAWMWSDYMWDHLDDFCRRMPTSILQSNWYYDANFDLDVDRAQDKRGVDDATRTTPLRAYLELERHGFDQIPTGSTDQTPVNFEGTVRFCQEQIAAERLLGFLQTVWRPVTEEYRSAHLDALQLVAQAKAAVTA